MPSDQTILVADSDPTVAALIAEVLTNEGYTVRCHASGQLTLDAVAEVQPDLVILEQWRAHPDVLPLIEALRQCAATQSTNVIVSSTDPRALGVLELPLHLRGFTTLPKPFDLELLLERVTSGLAPVARGYS